MKSRRGHRTYESFSTLVVQLMLCLKGSEQESYRREDSFKGVSGEIDTVRIPFLQLRILLENEIIPPNPYRMGYLRARVGAHRYSDGSMAVFHGPRKSAKCNEQLMCC